MNDKCELLHAWFNALKRYRGDFIAEIDSIPKNGIYIVFEKGEVCNGLDRVVRIGTHTGDNELRSRLKQHFLSNNKDRSIFRKNIGRCYLNRENSSYLKIWNMDFTTSKERVRNSSLIDRDMQERLEKKISRYMRENFSFAVFEVVDKAERLYLESKLISTVSRCDTCKSSNGWLGLASPVAKIRESGLWQVNELYKEVANVADIERISSLIAK